MSKLVVPVLLGLRLVWDAGYWMLDAGCAGVAVVGVVNSKRAKRKAATSCRTPKAAFEHQVSSIDIPTILKRPLILQP
jgi:hypothetical protein